MASVHKLKERAAEQREAQNVKTFANRTTPETHYRALDRPDISYTRFFTRMNLYFEEYEKHKEIQNPPISFADGVADPVEFRNSPLLTRLFGNAVEKHLYAGYSRARGEPQLLEAIIKYENLFVDRKYDTDNISMVNGVMRGTSLLLDVLVTYNRTNEFTHGLDEILVILPNYPSLSGIALRLHDAGLTSFKTTLAQETEDFSITASEVVRGITEKTRIMMLTNPNNPTGKYIPRRELEKIIEVCNEKRIYLLIDEIGDNYIFDEGSRKANYPININSEFVVRLRGPSKERNLAGVRIGYVLANKELIRDIEDQVPFSDGNPPKLANDFLIEDARLHYEVETCAPTTLEKDAITYKQEIEKNEQKLLDARNYTIKRLHNMMGVRKVIAPEANFNLFVQFAHEGGSHDLFEKILMTTGVIITPGICFGVPDSPDGAWMRFTFATSFEKLRRGLELIEYFLNTRGA
nr:pyridoxal phosphate-dependent aminotransferase [Candidatus Burarchaeum sp.]